MALLNPMLSSMTEFINNTNTPYYSPSKTSDIHFLAILSGRQNLRCHDTCEAFPILSLAFPLAFLPRSYLRFSSRVRAVLPGFLVSPAQPRRWGCDLHNQQNRAGQTQNPTRIDAHTRSRKRGRRSPRWSWKATGIRRWYQGKRLQTGNKSAAVNRDGQLGNREGP
jgi:hypothetical protein